MNESISTVITILIFGLSLDISSSEKSRVNEIRTSLLPAQRFNRISFAETVCWSHFQGVACDNFTNEEDIFERCFADGSRDYGSRLVTVPVHPQVSISSFPPLF